MDAKQCHFIVTFMYNKAFRDIYIKESEGVINETDGGGGGWVGGVFKFGRLRNRAHIAVEGRLLRKNTFKGGGGALTRKGAFIGKRALNRIITGRKQINGDMGPRDVSLVPIPSRILATS